MNYLVVNSQAFGDCLIGSHIVTLIKRTHPEANVTFAVPEWSWLTTSEQGALDEIIEILSIQNGVDTLALLTKEMKYNIRTGHGKAFDHADKLYQQHEWFSDLGFAKSAMVDFYIDNHMSMIHEYVEGQRDSSFIDTEVQFNVGKQKELPSHLRICMAGPKDWDRKYGKNPEIYDLFATIQREHPDAEILMLGRDISPVRYIKALQALNDSHLYIGPNGSLAIAAAGLGLDTIVLKDVFPASYDCPEFYHSGNHYHVGARPQKHCTTYPCITPKYFKMLEKRDWGNPKAEFGFWTQECAYMPDNKSCIANIETRQIYDVFNLWFENHGQYYGEKS